MLDIKLDPFTVILTCGPSGCGKSFFVENSLIPAIENNYTKHPNISNPRVRYISSDDERLTLLQDPLQDKFSNRMLQVSKQAFSVLENNLLNAIQYPVNTHFVIVDSTGLHKEWREKIIKLAADNQYKVVLLLFDYKERKDYQKYSQNGRLTEKHVKRLYETVIPALEKHEYKPVIKIVKHFTPEEVNVEVPALEVIAKNILTNEGRYYLLGDIHGCFQTLKKALSGVFKLPEEELEVAANLKHMIESQSLSADSLAVSGVAPVSQVLLCGDVIDKGTQSKEVIQFCLNNRDTVKWVVGNHERFVNDHFKTGGSSSKGVPHEVIQKYFTCIDQYKDDLEFQELLDTFVIEGSPYLQNENFILTHAPCLSRYLGKLDPVSVRKQQNLRFIKEDTKEAKEEELDFLVKEAEAIHPLHFFGHVATVEGIKKLNKIGIDTDCVGGNGLTVYEITGNRKPLKHFFVTDQRDLKGVACKLVLLNTLFDEQKVDLASLDGKVKSRIDWVCKNKVNYISGTMAPAARHVNTNEEKVNIESLEEALKYYKDKGVEQVTLQPKYMGSRCTMYLSNKTADCFMTSRNGFLIKKLHKPNVILDNFRYLFKQIKNQPKVAEFLKNKGIEYLVLDGELLPWYALGKGLVKGSYLPNYELVNSELKLLEDTGFAKHYADKLQEMLDIKDLDLGKLMKEKYNVGKTYEALLELESKGTAPSSAEKIAQLKVALRNFKKQIDVFGQPGNIEFKPFSILKVVYKDGSEKLFDYVSSFTEISVDRSCLVDLSSVYSSGAAKQAYQEFWDSCVEKNLEGVVVKPILEDPKLCKLKGIAPYLKVRNEEYLRLVYGYDYLENKQKYSKLAFSKNTKRKMEVSIAEFDLGLRMLEIPFKEVSTGNVKFKQLVAKVILEEENEKTLDPRL